MDEGKQGPDHGDERLAAAKGEERCRKAGVDEASVKRVGRGIGATAFNTETKAQNIDLSAWEANPDDQEAREDALVQELVGAADLFGPTQPRGPLGAYEYTVEMIYLKQNGELMQNALEADHATVDTTPLNMEEAHTYIASKPELREKLTWLVAGQAAFFKDYLKYSDTAIRAACGQASMTCSRAV
ncbi:MAG TPA: hypothetical protein VLF67_03895 [Candidatus Saccharimonas sp.]|nr:hypothetical protein [Candidatus Saccharimonas sp.]